MARRRFIHEFAGEEYLHKATWSVVKRQLDKHEETRKGALYDYLVAMVFASHTFEGYLNFIGDKLLPEVWKNERTEFQKTGATGKFEAVVQRCGLAPFDKGRRPYATISSLTTLRNKIAHPRTEKSPPTRKIYSEGKEPPLFPKSYLEKLVSYEKAVRARDDIKAVVDRIHSAAVSNFPGLQLGQDGLEGIASHHTGSSRLHTEDVTE